MINKNEATDKNGTTKAIYTKPTLVEYGSFAERTKLFGLQDPSPDLATATVTLTLTALSVSL